MPSKLADPAAVRALAELQHDRAVRSIARELVDDIFKSEVAEGKISPSPALTARFRLGVIQAWLDRQYRPGQRDVAHIERVWTATLGARPDPLARRALEVLLACYSDQEHDPTDAENIRNVFAMHFPEPALKLKLATIEAALSAWRSPRGNGGKYGPAFVALLAEAGLRVGDPRAASKKAASRRKRRGGQ